MINKMEPTLNLPQTIGSQAVEAMTGPVEISFQDSKARLSLRIARENLDQASAIFGFEIPSTIHGYVEEGGRAALCLGPDEWLIYAPEAEKGDLIGKFADIYATCPHSLTDISDRQVSIEIKGDEAANLLSIACPRDLRQLKTGSGTRTLFDSVEIVLSRHGEDHFELEVWRSFLPHVWALLAIGNQELASDTHLA